MKKIPLTRGKFALVDDSDFNFLAQFKWCAYKNAKSGVWYALRNIRRPNGKWRTIFMHQVLLPGVPQIDHRDGNGLNNRRKNIRPCTYSQNNINQHKRLDNTSGHKGVYKHSYTDSWVATIGVNGKHVYLGIFKQKKDAIKVRKEAALLHYGEFVKT